ncbi:PA14 domain-containing protein [Methylomonas sp. 2BW1-5-20]|uniref:PA14 domain-containing protein n=1 Tax=Methylomonas sp. 2BW1-5-20 TaxID=3376686 RepID=UPI00404D1DF2
MKMPFVCLCLPLGLLVGISSARADVVLTSSIALPGVSGSGLSGSYYAFNSWPGTLANTETLIGQLSGPTATFTATSACFPACSTTIGDDSTLAQYLGGNAVSLSPNSINNLSNHGLVLNGYLAIVAPGTYQFSVASDDGARLQIGGTTVIDADGDHSLSGGSANVEFTNSGLYAFKVLAFEDGGVTGLTVLQNGNSLTTSQLYTSAVPIPGAAWLFFSALSGIGAYSRTQRKSA